MLVYPTAPGVVPCRTAVVSACEREVDSSPNADIEALACFQMRLRDKLDFTVDFGPWLQANGGPVLTGAIFAAAGDSPQEPTISGQTFNAAGKVVVVLTPPVDAAVGDAYWLDVTAQVAATVAVLPTDVAIPARTLVRRIHVVLANG